ncbi:Methyltransferase type 12 [Macleaya cordata]|uniref:Methyltransferase type 12 n=1 Tax=Macleaya cordata TaxID=56857 RepID=A0A200Q218_MACCD|nr:Methyltransferase type 12 [Macleaya cordata]
MASTNGQQEQQQPQPSLPPTPKLQIYSTASTGISPFWREKYERDAKKYWDVFYKRHQDRFFKDRHYLDKEWGRYFHVFFVVHYLQVGCGAGNTIFPLVATYPDIFVHACDFSPRAVDLVKSHKDFTSDRVNAFVCDLTVDDLCKQISPSSVDLITMIFVLSAVAPEKMTLVLQNIRKVLKPNGLVLLRDYAVGDLAQERFTCKDQKISENFYVRGDGTRAFYFSEEFLTSLFKENGFDTEELGLCCKQVENRSRELVMNRRWIQSVFRSTDGLNSSCISESGNKVALLGQHTNEPALNGSNSLKEPIDGFEIDMSESIAVEMFSVPSSIDEIININLGECSFRIKGLSREHQHTCKSTGLMLWESARLMSGVLATNPSIVEGKRVLELGSGCTGICSMVAAKSADLVVATDGDMKAIDLLNQNVVSNLEQPILNKLFTKRLEWGNRDQIEAIKEMNPKGFEVIIGTDVTYVREAISPLFATASELISYHESVTGVSKPALILCHVVRRVDEISILSTASQFGFRLLDRWPTGMSIDSSQNIISSWFSGSSYERDLSYVPLNILYFHKQ